MLHQRTGMEEKKEIHSLLRNLQKGVKKHGLKKLSDAIAAISDNTGEDKNIKTILKCVCEEFKISNAELITSTERGDIQDARNVAVCLLHFHLELSVRYIAKRVFNREYHTFATAAIKRYNLADKKIKADMQYLEVYSRVESVVKTKIKK